MIKIRKSSPKVMFIIMIWWLIQGILSLYYFDDTDISKLIGIIMIIIGTIGIELLILLKFLPYIKLRFEEYVRRISKS